MKDFFWGGEVTSMFFCVDDLVLQDFGWLLFDFF